MYVPKHTEGAGGRTHHLAPVQITIEITDGYGLASVRPGSKG